MIYGIGSMYGSTDEKLPQFLDQNVACVGWPRDEAPALHQLLAQISVGDIIYIKSHPPRHGLFVKAVGIVDSPEIFRVPNGLGDGRSVQWIWNAPIGSPYSFGQVNDRYNNFRTGTLYQELGPTVQSLIVHTVVNGEPPEQDSNRCSSGL